MRGAQRIREISVAELSCNIEVGWSPDSEQFFISWSDGGAIGGYHVRAFRVEGEKVTELNAPKIAYADFKKHHFCETRTDNIFMLGWTPDSQKIFVVMEVYPTSDCQEMSLFRGYLMDTQSGATLRVFGEKDTEEIKERSRAAGAVQLP